MDDFHQRSQRLLDMQAERLGNRGSPAAPLSEEQALALRQKIASRLQKHQEKVRQQQTTVVDHSSWIEGVQDSQHMEVETIVRPRRRPEETVEDTLIEHGRRREQELQLKRAEKYESLREELTFQPQINEHSRRLLEARSEGERVEERLHRQDARVQQRLQQMRAQKEEEAEENTPSFHPQINHNIPTNTEGPVEDRTAAWQAARDRRVAAEAAARRATEERESSAVPAINPRSRQMARRLADSGERSGDVSDHLYHDAQRMAAAKSAAAARNMAEEAPLRPTITPKAARLRREGPVGDRLYESGKQQQRKLQSRIADRQRKAEQNALAAVRKGRQRRNSSAVLGRPAAAVAGAAHPAGGDGGSGGGGGRQRASLYEKAVDHKQRQQAREAAAERRRLKLASRGHVSDRSRHILSRVDKSSYERLTEGLYDDRSEHSDATTASAGHGGGGGGGGLGTTSARKRRQQQAAAEAEAAALTFRPRINPISERIALVRQVQLEAEMAAAAEAEEAAAGAGGGASGGGGAAAAAGGGGGSGGSGRRRATLGSVPVGERLYVQHRARDGELRAKRRAKEEAAMQECTFKPRLVASRRSFAAVGGRLPESSGGGGSGGSGASSVFDRLARWQQQRDRRVEKERAAKEGKTLQGCTFKPKLTHTSLATAGDAKRKQRQMQQRQRQRQAQAQQGRRQRSGSGGSYAEHKDSPQPQQRGGDTAAAAEGSPGAVAAAAESQFWEAMQRAHAAAAGATGEDMAGGDGASAGGYANPATTTAAAATAAAGTVSGGSGGAMEVDADGDLWQRVLAMGGPEEGQWEGEGEGPDGYHRLPRQQQQSQQQQPPPPPFPAPSRGRSSESAESRRRARSRSRGSSRRSKAGTGYSARGPRRSGGGGGGSASARPSRVRSLSPGAPAQATPFQRRAMADHYSRMVRASEERAVAKAADLQLSLRAGSDRDNTRIGAGTGVGGDQGLCPPRTPAAPIAVAVASPKPAALRAAARTVTRKLAFTGAGGGDGSAWGEGDTDGGDPAAATATATAAPDRVPAPTPGGSPAPPRRTVTANTAATPSGGGGGGGGGGGIASPAPSRRMEVPRHLHDLLHSGASSPSPSPYGTPY